ncbi:MAG: 3-hydroxyacyl-ACP dehydratase FabZ [Bdellovibrionales bacterium]|nr:3-hydroxyacyl-ACP dehydratase FabZ [Bdellovibrionales bacterium]
MASKPVYDISDILRILPHRFPFLLVDRVDVLDRDLASLKAGKNRVGWKIQALKNVTFNEPFFPGHFPHRPVMPGVLQIEAMAQAACLCVVDPDGPEMDVAIAGINEARFRRPVVPGDQLVLHAEILKDRGQIMVIKCSMTIDGEVASEVEMIAKVFPKEVPAKVSQKV